MAVPQLCQGGLWLLWGQLGLGNSQELLGASPGSAAANEQAKAAIFSQNLPTAAGGRNAARSSLRRKMGGGAGTRWKKRVRCGAGVALAAGTSRCHLGGIPVPSSGPTGNALLLRQGQVQSEGDNMAACGVARPSWGHCW